MSSAAVPEPAPSSGNHPNPSTYTIPSLVSPVFGVSSTVNDNYNEVYHCVREGYAAGYEPDGESFAASVDYGDIYSRMSFLLGLEEDGDGYVRINNGGEQEYRLSNLSVSIPNNALGAGGGSYYADASIRLEIPVRFAGKIITNMSINLKVRAAYTEKF